jgi:REP element-mobilizing transposase RayT
MIFRENRRMRLAAFVQARPSMTMPRRIVPGQFVFITRSVTQRMFLLRPDDETNNAFIYLLGEAAKRFGLVVILAQMMSNHYHAMLYDAEGRYSEFLEHFHKFVAKSQNALRGRWENLWSTEETCVVEIMDRPDLLDKLVYIATNPVKDGLVEKVHHWPGPSFVHALLSGRTLHAHRPTHFFRSDGPMPDEVELVLMLPDDFDDKEGFIAELRRRIAEVENECSRERHATGRRVLGRRCVIEQAWWSSPTTLEPRRGLRPRVAARNKWLRIATLQRNKEWQAAYRDARRRWTAGEDVAFPYGTYWLMRFAHVRIEPTPEPNN